MKQPDTEFTFQGGDLPTQGRLREVQLLGGPREMAGLGDLNETAELIEIHIDSLRA
ncbi:hypothetical protein GCM10009805_26630 [Leucobacter chromiireducens subsp. solipictus]